MGSQSLLVSYQTFPPPSLPTSFLFASHTVCERVWALQAQPLAGDMGAVPSRRCSLPRPGSVPCSAPLVSLVSGDPGTSALRQPRTDAERAALLGVKGQPRCVRAMLFVRSKAALPPPPRPFPQTRFLRGDDGVFLNQGLVRDSSGSLGSQEHP